MHLSSDLSHTTQPPRQPQHHSPASSETTDSTTYLSPLLCIKLLQWLFRQFL
jgi:hypothetical protein